MEYRLKIDGDVIEKESWDLFIQEKFPYYEIFWLEFVIPRTNRPDNLFLKKEFLLTDKENEALITQIHYSIIVHFNYIFKYINYCENDFIFENLITRLSSITDLTEEFIFRYLIYLKKIDLKKYINENKKSVKINLKDAIKELKKGCNYSIPVFNKLEISQNVFNTENVKNLFNLIKEIRSYRNKIIHSYALFKIGNKVPNRHFLTNPDLKEYLIWSKMYDVLNYKKGTPEFIKIINNYIDKKELINQYYNKLIKNMNFVWKDLLNIE